jgi:hypothetical protein
MVSDPKASRLPRFVLYAFVAAGVAAALAAVSLGWETRGRSHLLLFYFAALAAALALAYLFSGNTLMHHFRTGTINRRSSPAAYWVVVVVHFALAAVLLVLGIAARPAAP